MTILSKITKYAYDIFDSLAQIVIAGGGKPKSEDFDDTLIVLFYVQLEKQILPSLTF